TAKATHDPDALLTAADLAVAERTDGRIPDGAIVLVRTGWERWWSDRGRYLGSTTPGDAAHLHFPGVGEDAAIWLTTALRIRAPGEPASQVFPGAADILRAGGPDVCARHMPGRRRGGRRDGRAERAAVPGRGDRAEEPSDDPDRAREDPPARRRGEREREGADQGHRARPGAHREDAAPREQRLLRTDAESGDHPARGRPPRLL